MKITDYTRMLAVTALKGFGLLVAALCALGLVSAALGLLPATVVTYLVSELGPIEVLSAVLWLLIAAWLLLSPNWRRFWPWALLCFAFWLREISFSLTKWLGLNELGELAFVFFTLGLCVASLITWNRAPFMRSLAVRGGFLAFFLAACALILVAQVFEELHDAIRNADRASGFAQTWVKIWLLNGLKLAEELGELMAPALICFAMVRAVRNQGDEDHLVGSTP